LGEAHRRPANRVAAIAVALLSLSIPTSALAQGSFGAPDDAPPRGDGDRRAFLIGINDYQDPSFSTLRYARNDAEGLAAVLNDDRYGGFTAVEVAVDGDMTAAGLISRIETWAATLAPDDLAMIYISSHGTRFVDERGRSRVFLAAADTLRADPVNTGLPVQALQEALEALPATRRVLVVDACFTGDGKVSDGDAQAAARSMIDEKLPFSDKVADKEAQLFATTYGRPALESERLGHGVYTAHLIDALSERFDEADLNGDLVVSVSEAHDYARDRTMETTGQLQIPMVFYKLVGKEDLLLSGDPGSRRRVEMAMVSAYEGPQQGLRLFVDGEEKGAFPRTVLVDPGKHAVEFRNLDGKIVDSGRVRFRKEGVYSVRKIRDQLNGGRHLVAAGYTHTWLPGEAQNDQVPAASGFRVAYSFRFPSRNPLLRRLGLVFDVAAGFYGPQFTDIGVKPSSTLLDVGIGPVIRLDIPFLVLSVQPRFALATLFRREADQPFLNWTFGAIGGTFGAGFRPINRLSFQFQYTLMGYDVGIQGEQAKLNLMHRLGGHVEFGF